MNIFEVIYFGYLINYLKLWCMRVALQLFLIFGIFETYAKDAQFIPYLIIIVALFFALALHKKFRQSGESFIRHRIFVAVSIFTLEILFWVNAFTIGVCSAWFNIVITILMHLILLYFPISLIHHFPWMFRGMRFSHLKNAKTNFSDKLILSFFYLLLLFIFIFYICQIDLDTWDDERRPEYFSHVRGILVFFTLLSVPMLNQAILAWNRKKLKFEGLHPTTGRAWEGVMKKNEGGEWEVDLEPEEHELVEVRVL